MIQNRRQRLQDLFARIRMEGVSSLDSLAAHFGVSTATIRRDIKHLEKNQPIVQTVGGGVVYRQNRTSESGNGNPGDLYIEEKIRIAEYCTELIEEFDEIIVGPGPTAMLVGRILTGISDRRFRIVTNSLELAIEASAVANIETVIVGGEIHERHSIGFSAHEDYFSACHTNHKLIISADGVSSGNGVTLFDPRFLPVLQKMVAVSETVILAVSSHKVGKTTFSRVCDLEAITILVTDKNAPAAECQAIERRGVTVVTT